MRRWPAAAERGQFPAFRAIRKSIILPAVQMTFRAFVALIALASIPASAFAGTSGFALVNGTEVAIDGLSIRRAGTQDWKPLGKAPAPGAKGSIGFNDPDCAFDIRATVPGHDPVTWAGINLCDVKSVTLKRDTSAGAWVDYDQ